MTTTHATALLETPALLSDQSDGPALSEQSDRSKVIERLKENLQQGDQLFQVVGADIDNLLSGKPKETFRTLAAKTGFPRSTLSDYHKAWRLVPTPADLRVGEKTGTFTHALRAHEAANKIKRAYKEIKVKLDVRKLFEDAVLRGMTTRDLRAKYEKRAQRIRNKRLAKERAAAIPAADWYNRCHHGDCVDVLQSLPDGSIDFVILDPPYWPYHDSQGKGGLRQNSYRGTVLTKCAMYKMAEAKGKMLELIPLLPKKLTAGGTILYWNTGFHSDDWMIVKAFEDAGLPNYRAGVWWKKSEAPTIQNDPHTTTFERWLIQRRSAKAAVSHDFSVGRNNFLTDEPVVRVEEPLVVEDTMVPKKSAFYHLMEKPESLTERFLRAYCPPNSLVFDAYGCSGSSCCAAIKLGHRFVYCEKLQQNYKYGAGRIAEAMRQQSDAAKCDNSIQ